MTFKEGSALAKLWKILTIDDDALMHKIIKKELLYSYEVISASSGKVGIDTAIREMPDVILLDVEMPGMNGYEVCDQLKSIKSTENIPVIFLSSLSNIRSRMLGYEAGAADYLVKPFESGELNAKLDSLISLLKHSKVKNTKIQQATNTAFSAMKDSSELGMCINFIETSYGVKDFDSLASCFFNVCHSLELDCSIMFLIRDKRIFYSGTGSKCSALEQEVISNIFDKGGRYIDFGCRTQINFSHVALFIKNMPLYNLDTYGRYKDFFPFMLGATDAKVKSLEAEIGIATQTKELSKALDVVKSNLGNLKGNIDHSQETLVSLLKSMLSQLEHVIPSMGLEEDQESTIMKIIDITLESSYKVIDTNENNLQNFSVINDVLEKLVKQQQSLSDIISIEVVDQSRISLDKANDIQELSDDVELF